MANFGWGSNPWGYDGWGGVGVEAALSGVAASGAVGSVSETSSVAETV